MFPCVIVSSWFHFLNHQDNETLSVTKFLVLNCGVKAYVLNFVLNHKGTESRRFTMNVYI